MPFSRQARHAPGIVLYDGPSLIDGEPVVVVATGIFTPSSNKKTGWMVQTWILRSDVHPVEAVKQGKDVSICGDCKLRFDARIGARRCYVVLHEAPATVFRTFRAGRYVRATSGDLKKLHALPVRAGSYGDPGAVPLHVWQSILGPVHTGYTHQWRTREDLMPYLMASVDDVVEMHQARALGWRTYRVGIDGEEALRPGEAVCVNVTRGTRCEQCHLCDGADRHAPSIVTPPHGAAAKKFALAVFPT